MSNTSLPNESSFANLREIGKIHNAGLAYLSKIYPGNGFSQKRDTSIEFENNFRTQILAFVHDEYGYDTSLIRSVPINPRYNGFETTANLNFDSLFADPAKSFSDEVKKYCYKFIYYITNDKVNLGMDSIINDTQLTTSEKELLVGALSIGESSYGYWYSEFQSTERFPMITPSAIADIIGYVNIYEQYMSGSNCATVNCEPAAIAAATTESITQSQYFTMTTGLP